MALAAREGSGSRPTPPQAWVPLQRLLQFSLAPGTEPIHPSCHVQIVERKFNDMPPTAEAAPFFDADQTRVETYVPKFSVRLCHRLFSELVIVSQNF